MPHSRFVASASGGIAGTLRDLHQLDPRRLQQVGHGLQLVLLAVVNGAEAGVDENLQAMDAGGVRHVDVRVANRGAVARGLSYRVDLGMDGAKAVLLDL